VLLAVLVAEVLEVVVILEVLLQRQELIPLVEVVVALKEMQLQLVVLVVPE
jgi:hypothetical protein